MFYCQLFRVLHFTTQSRKDVVPTCFVCKLLLGLISFGVTLLSHLANRLGFGHMAEFFSSENHYVENAWLSLLELLI